jgi:hypothetical protein
MPIKYETIKPGDVLYQKIRFRTGDPVLDKDLTYEVRVVDVTVYGADVIWNGHNKERWDRTDLESLYRSRPKTKPNPFSRSS